MQTSQTPHAPAPSGPDMLEEIRQKEIARFTKHKSRKKWIVLAVIAVIVAAGAFFILRPKDNARPVSTIPLARGELVNRINLTGMVESARMTRVYSLQTGIVQTVHVREGDRVEAGQLLAELDTTELEASITQQQVTLRNAEQSNAMAMAISEKGYRQQLADFQTEDSAEFVTAEQNILEASINLANARQRYKDNVDDSYLADREVARLEGTLSKARRARDKAYADLTDAKKAGATDLIIADLEQKAADSSGAYEAALVAWQDGYREFASEFNVFSEELHKARLAYEQSMKNKEVLIRDSLRALDSLIDEMEKARVDGDLTVEQMALQSLQRELEQCFLTAPVSGTVTAVYAKEGPPGGGLMFVLEDPDDLSVATKIKEYDVGSVKEGLRAVVKTGATGEAEFEGTVRRIATAADKGEDGSTLSGGNVEFEAEVALTAPHSGLRIGMNARLSLILEEKQDVFSVPFDAVVPDGEGNEVVYVLRTGEDGKSHAAAVRVVTGLETDFYVEIDSPELTEGDSIITDPSGLSNGDAVAPSNAAGVPA